MADVVVLREGVVIAVGVNRMEGRGREGSKIDGLSTHHDCAAASCCGEPRADIGSYICGHSSGHRLYSFGNSYPFNRVDVWRRTDRGRGRLRIRTLQVDRVYPPNLERVLNPVSQAGNDMDRFRPVRRGPCTIIDPVIVPNNRRTTVTLRRLPTQRHLAIPRGRSQIPRRTRYSGRFIDIHRHGIGGRNVAIAAHLVRERRALVESVGIPRHAHSDRLRGSPVRGGKAQARRREGNVVIVTARRNGHSARRRTGQHHGIGSALPLTYSQRTCR